MSEPPPPPNTLSPLRGVRSVTPGDVPERLAARYYRETRLFEHRFYVDAQVKTPAFRDLGRRLATPRSDPNSVRDMVAIAAHRGWTVLEARGSPRFRREAWLAGQSRGLEVRGYRPTERDRQDLARRGGRDRQPPDRSRPELAAARLEIAEAVIAARVADPQARLRLLERAQARLEAWLARGARLAEPPDRARDPAREGPERRRTH